MRIQSYDVIIIFISAIRERAERSTMLALAFLNVAIVRSNIVEGSASDGLIRSCFDAKCQHWNDTDGNRIEAHAAGMLQSHEDHRWYWYGESKKNGPQNLAGVNLYSAADLAGPWTNEGQVLKQTDIVVPGKVSERELCVR